MDDQQLRARLREARPVAGQAPVAEIVRRGRRRVVRRAATTAAVLVVAVSAAAVVTSGRSADLPVIGPTPTGEAHPSPTVSHRASPTASPRPTASPGGPTSAPAGPTRADVVLGAATLGVTDIGAPMVEAMDRLDAALGPPTSLSPWSPGDEVQAPTGPCVGAGAWWRWVEWGQLGVLFATDVVGGTEDAPLVAWTYGWVEGTEAEPLRTAAGVTRGTGRDEAIAAHGDAARFVDNRDLEVVPSFVELGSAGDGDAPRVLVGVLDALGERVIALEGGAPCDLL